MKISRYYTFVFLIITLITGVATASLSSYWSQSGILSSGQSAVHDIQVDCSARIVLTSPDGAVFDLNAVQDDAWFGNYRFGTSEEYIRSHPDVVSSTRGTTPSLTLKAGSWHVLVTCRSGRGTYLLDATDLCGIPAPSQDPRDRVWHSPQQIMPGGQPVNAQPPGSPGPGPVQQNGEAPMGQTGLFIR